MMIFFPKNNATKKKRLNIALLQWPNGLNKIDPQKLDKSDQPPQWGPLFITKKKRNYCMTQLIIHPIVIIKADFPLLTYDKSNFFECLQLSRSYLHSGPSICVDFSDLVSDLLGEEARTPLFFVAQHASFSHPSIVPQQINL